MKKIGIIATLDTKSEEAAYLSGAFDTFPNLKVVIGHYGEGLPFLLDRIDVSANFQYLQGDPDAFVPLKKRPSAYLRENMWVSTSCNYLPGAFSCSWNDLGKTRVVFGTDYPYAKISECLGFLAGRGLTEEEEELLYFKNAAQLGVSL